MTRHEIIYGGIIAAALLFGPAALILGTRFLVMHWGLL